MTRFFYKFNKHCWQILMWKLTHKIGVKTCTFDVETFCFLLRSNLSKGATKTTENFRYKRKKASGFINKRRTGTPTQLRFVVWTQQVQSHRLSWKKYKQELIDDAPVGRVLFCQESGWMTVSFFWSG